MLNGEKTWITNGSIADVAIVWARAEDGIRGFLVEKGTPGFTSSEIHGKLSMRASVTSSLALQRLPRAGERDAAGREGAEGSAGLPDAGALRDRLGRDRARRWIATRRRASYSVLRKQFDDKPIASHQLVQEKLADMITEITKAQLLALHVRPVEGSRGRSSRRTFRC